MFTCTFHAVAHPSLSRWAVPFKNIQLVTSVNGAAGISASIYLTSSSLSLSRLPSSLISGKSGKRVSVPVQSKPKGAVGSVKGGPYPPKNTTSVPTVTSQSYPALSRNAPRGNNAERRPGVPANKQSVALPPSRLDKRVTSTTTAEKRVKVSHMVAPLKVSLPQ